MCQNIFPNIHRHDHHKVPRSLGGSDSPANLVSLCPQCHDLLHNVAYKMISKKVSTITLEDMVRMTYEGDMASVKRSWELASLVRDELIKNKESKLPANEFVDISMQIRHKHKMLLQEMAKSHKISMEAMMRRIILRAISDTHSITIDLKKEEDDIRKFKRK